MTDPMSPAPQPPALAPQVLHCPTLKYTVVNEQPCAVCGEPLRSGDLCYRNSAENPDEWRHLSHGPPAPVASSPAHRICFVGTCGKPDVNAPDEGTWPTCSKYPPACVDHLAFVPPPQRKGVASSPAAPEVGAYDIVLGLIEVAKSEEPETAFSRLVIQRLRRVRDMLEAASSPAPPASGDRKMEEQKTDGLLGCTASGIQHGPPSTSRRPSDALATYAEWCGSIHDDGCPQDDTCDCSAKWINDGVTDAVNILKSTGR
jgi:hypothetical protein